MIQSNYYPNLVILSNLFIVLCKPPQWRNMEKKKKDEGEDKKKESWE